ncbi:MAG: transcription-repair coupling factor [Chloroflexi bacterium]|nr:transcription-repair coupling factor [Chloroflexota bacterium]
MDALARLSQRLATVSPTTDIVAAVGTDPGQRLHVAPIAANARAVVTAALANAIAVPIVYVVATNEHAIDAHDDLCAWLGATRVMLFPALDALPYEATSASPDLTTRRLTVLQRLLRDHQVPLVIVTPVGALTQPTLSRADLVTATSTLDCGAICPLPALVQRWVEMGYRPAATVAEPGEISRRGGIVDIFPPGDELPLRIEFWGDEIDSMRRYDPVTQQSETRVTRAVVGPPVEYARWRSDQALRLIQALDVDSMRTNVRAEWHTAMNKLAEGLHVESIVLFQTFFRDITTSSSDSATLLEYIPENGWIVCDDAAYLQNQVVHAEIQAMKRRDAKIQARELPHDYRQPILGWDDILRAVRQRPLITLDGNVVAAEEVVVSGIPAARTLSLPGTLLGKVPSFGGQLRQAAEAMIARVDAGDSIIVVSPHAARLTEVLNELAIHHGRASATQQYISERISLVHGSLSVGVYGDMLRTLVVTDAEIFGWRPRRIAAERRRRRDRGAEERAAFLRGLRPGDHVVHIEHGIAAFDGLVQRTVGGIERDYLSLRYAGQDRLYVPVDQADRVSRYIGAGDAAPTLTRLGTRDWERAKRKARAAARDLADELMKLYARRQASAGYAFSADTPWQYELEATFPWTETPDQLQAISDVKCDMERAQPMDRLVCGDVGFGKTEVALRAAFKAVQDGKQVAVLVPTTVLAQQHFETFSRRMQSYPVVIELLSRLRTPQQQKETISRLLSGAVDIIIGTHRILSKDIVFRDLGLLITDEEQRFGVRHKERLKELRTNVDALTLTATPIPRTLHMALAGIRDLSVIDTPPPGRLPVRTYIQPYDQQLIRESIMRELDRGGQVFFVHNHVYDIYEVAASLRTLVPECEIVVGHGQLHEHQLERVMLTFYEGRADVLVSTTIIESGLDVPNANTIIIDDATSYGLAQLYQLRGRVGRSPRQAYAYLFYRSDELLTSEAHERLQAIQEATELGAGFRIAMRDLEIRGAGSLLGAEQSGHIAAVGFDLYSRLLEQAVTAMKLQLAESPDAASEPHDPATTHRQPASVVPHEQVLVSPLVTIDLPLNAYIPAEYITDEPVRLSIYQSLAQAETPDDVRRMRAELIDRFGALPEPVEALIIWLTIKALASLARVESIVTGDAEFIIKLPESGDAARERLRRRYLREPGIKLGPRSVRLDRRAFEAAAANRWIATMMEILELIAR